MTGAHLRVDLPGRWRLDLGVGPRGVLFDLAAPPPPAPPAPPSTPPASSPPAPRAPERPTLEGGAYGEFERDPYGFTAPRWSPLEDGDPDP